MTYDVWSQTGPQSGGQLLNLSQYMKGGRLVETQPSLIVPCL